METKETKETNRIEVIKPRSYVSCLAEGLKFPLLHFTEIIRQLWLLVLFAAILHVCLGEVMQHILDSYAHTLQMSTARLVAICGLLAVDWLGMVLVSGAVLYQQYHLTDEGRLPRVRLWTAWRKLISPTLRNLLAFVIMLLFSGVGVWALIAAAVYHQPLFLIGGGVSLLLLLVQGPVLLEFFFARISYLKALMRVRWRYAGRFYAVLLISGIVFVLSLLIATLPAMLVTYVDFMSFQSVVTGDTLLLPTQFPILRALTNFLFILVGLYTSLFIAYPMLFHWGSITAIEQLRQEEAEKAEG